MRQAGQLDDGDFIQLHVFSDRLLIVERGLRECALHQPAPGIGMAVVKKEQGMQPGLLAARGEEEYEIEAGGKALLENVGRKSHFLAHRLVAGKWSDVADSFTSNRLVKRRELLPDALAAFVLISVQRAPAGVGLEDLCGRIQNAHHGGIVGHDKRREDFGE